MQSNRAKRLIVGIAVLMLGSWARADVPTNLNVQGRLTDAVGDPVSAGLRIFTFKIYNAEVGGTEIWPAAPGEQQTLLTDDDGLWNAEIGSIIPLTETVFQDTSRWLAITVDDGVNPPETLSRIKMNTNPFTYRSASSQHADVAGQAQNAASAQTADLLDGQHASAFAGSGHDHDVSYVKLTGGTMTGGLTLPVAYLGDASSWNGVLKLFQPGSAQPLVHMYPYSGGKGGAIDIRDEAGNFTVTLEPDATGNGGYFMLNGGKSASYFVVNGMTSSVDSNLTLVITGSGSGTTFNTNASGNSSVQLPSNAVSASEILDEPGIAANSDVGSVSISQQTTMQTLISVSITIPSTGYIVVEGECYAILSGTTGDNRVISDISEGGTGGTSSAPWFTNDGLKDYGSVGGCVLTITPRRWFAKTAGTYTFNFRARHIGTAPASAVMWYPKIVAQYFPTSYGSVAAMVTAEEASSFEQSELAEPVAGDDGSGVIDHAASYRVDLRELEIRALKARAEAEQAERELAEARAAEQLNIRSEMKDESR